MYKSIKGINKFIAMHLKFHWFPREEKGEEMKSKYLIRYIHPLNIQVDFFKSILFSWKINK
jgi:hypothetical protein